MIGVIAPRQGHYYQGEDGQCLKIHTDKFLAVPDVTSLRPFFTYLKG